MSAFHAPSPTLKVLDVALHGDAVLVATSEHLLVNFWFGVPSGAEMRALGEAQFAWADTFDARYALLTVILPGAGFKLDEAARQAAADIRARAEARTAANATLIEESGFRASMARSIVSAIELLIRAKHEARVFKALDEASAFVHLAAQADTWTPSALAHDVRHLSAMLTRR